MLPTNTSTYTPDFFDSMEAGALRSAEVVLPLAFDLLSPQSVIDIGCGRGAWLRVAMELGIPRVLGLDGTYVDPENLLIPRDRFLPADLRRPFQTPGIYDLALCLEVAEHLPKRAAAPLVASLAAAAPAVLFSAAIPGQPGTRHINPQFPEYWCRLFAEHDYVALDALRPRVRSDIRVEPWYRQNLLLFVSRPYYRQFPSLCTYQPVKEPSELLPWVYAGLWRGRVQWRGTLSVARILLGQMFR
jgi:SAM-dependent methyltransferase